MKFSTSAVLTLTLSHLFGDAIAFAPAAKINGPRYTNSNSNNGSARFMSMAMDMPPATAAAPTASVASSSDLPVVQTRGGAPASVRYSDFLKLVKADRVEKVTFSADGTQLLGVDTDGSRLKIEALPNDPDLLTELTSHKVDVTVLPSTESSGGLGELAQSLVLPAVLFAGLFFLSRNAGGGGMPGGGPGNPMGFGKSKAEIQMIPDTGVNFEDVAGCDGAKLELAEVVDFLKQPEVYSANGCRIPRGVILDGPPGTGKTLLARALASNINGTFLKVVASAIVDKYIGESARIIREMFGFAKDHQPCVIFMDEIDAIGGSRFSEGTSADREIQRTLMELLNQMDGFEDQGQVKMVMATNRPDILDPALLRPGRLDRKIEIPEPNETQRLEILKIHSSGITKRGNIDWESVVKLADGLNGADMRNICTEAGLFAIRSDRDYCLEEDFTKAARKILDNKKLETKLDYSKV
mmetsp:Transcript_39445/g.80928  ORF Transcript_39445/g.80928 Transcript_39445/m.80928 type:complete len:468 (+) Transcript_39445:357-1760(+)